MSEPMTLRRYLYGDAKEKEGGTETPPNCCAALLSAYRSTLAEFAQSGAKACPALAQELEKGLSRMREALSGIRVSEDIQAIASSMQEMLREWGDKTARHYEQKSGEVRDLLLVMSRTAESLGQKDDQYTGQLDAVTSHLETIATLEDISRIRASVEESARELKLSIARMTAENKAVIDHLRVEVSTYQTRLEQAEYIASRDALTGVGSRRWMEERIREKVEAGAPFSILLIDICGFGEINTEYGDLAGDLLLKEFAKELRSSCRFSDMVARWGGDEFIVLMDCAGIEARGQIARLHSWICGAYSVRGRGGQVHVRLDVSLGTAEYRTGEEMESILERADEDLCSFREMKRGRMTA